MRANEMTETQRAIALERHGRADEIIADYEAQHEFKLPPPWREAIPRLLLQGLGDPELHLVFNTVAQVEFAAGRLAEQPADYGAFKD